MDYIDRHKELAPGAVAVIGVPLDENSSFMRGPAEAPSAIRESLHSYAANLCAENGIDLGAEPRFVELGNLHLGSGLEAFAQIEKAVAGLLERGVRVLSLGGDHAITYPLVKAYAQKYEKLTILHFDAHPDLYDEIGGNRHSHGCPFARIMEENLAARLVQVGVRTMSPHQRDQAERFGVEVHEMRTWHKGLDLTLEGPLYISLDLDVLDPAFAPGISHHEPGGLSTREVLTIIHRLDAPIVGADIVEYNPRQDLGGVTGMTAAKFLKEIAAAMLETNEVPGP